MAWLQRFAPPAAVGVVFLALWEGLCRIAHIPVYVFPAPSAIAVRFTEQWAVLLHALGATLLVTFEALFIAVVLGTLTAFVFVQSPTIERCFFPYAIFAQVTPIVAIAPLIIILVKSTTLALTICAALVAIFPMISNTTIGLRSVDPGLLSYFQMNKASRLNTLVRLRVPSALPYFLAGLRISSGLALIGAIVAEFVAGTGGRNAGLAYQILQAGFQLDIPMMLAALILIALSGVTLYLLTVWLTKVLLGHWHESELAQEN